MLPAALKDAIDEVCASVPVARLRAAAAAMAERYRDGATAMPDDEARRIAYVVARMPATFAAVRAALARLAAAAPRLAPASLLDLGAGPATGLWAVEDVFGGSIAHATLLDSDTAMLALGTRLREAATHRAAPFQGADRPRLDVVHASLTRPPALPPHDLVLCAYVLGELDARNALEALGTAWHATSGALVVVEPGWPRGHARLMAWRSRLMEWGAHVIAPCPHDLGCPLEDDDWCHFATRLERTRLHRRVKDGSLGWEDEKFAYLVATRAPARRPPARIIHPPRIEKGHVCLRLCRDGRAEPLVVSRRDGRSFKAARKARWGDGWPAHAADDPPARETDSPARGGDEPPTR